MMRDRQSSIKLRSSTSSRCDRVRAFWVFVTDLLCPLMRDRESSIKLRSSTSSRSEGEKKCKSSTATMVAENGNHENKNVELASVDYELPLVWIDLEMTGLNVEVDRILEIACIITDGSLSNPIEGPDLIIHQSQECLDKMDEWCQDHHGASGLTEKVLKSSISEREAEKQVMKFVKDHVGNCKPLLAGNSVYADFIFLKKYMPDLASLFSHVTLDVSSLKSLCVRWYIKDHKKAPQKDLKHRALDDIRESIAQLKYYKETIFK